MDNATRFLDAFAHIEKELKRLTGQGNYTKFYQLLKDAGEVNDYVKKKNVDLQEYADLRNAIVHNRTESGLVLAQPTDEVVEDIENIAAYICDERLVESVFIKDVIVCKLSDNLVEVAKLMEKMDTTKMPVYEEGEFMFLLTSEMIERYFLNHLDSIEQCSVRDCEVYLRNNENVLFINRTVHINTVRDYFIRQYNKGKNLKAVIITENASRHEKALGIITLTDVI